MSDMSRRTFGKIVGAAAVGAALPNTAMTLPADDLCYMSAVELAARIRRKESRRARSMAAHLARIERVNPKVNAIVTLVAERAMADAARADEALARGDALGRAARAAGRAQGSRRHGRHPHDARLAVLPRPRADARRADRRRAIRAAGAITLGKTNTPEFGAGSQTFNTVFGATRNPYDSTKTCGGSSGGAAVVARVRHAADRRRQRHGRLAPQSRRRSATSSASGRRPAACRASRRRGRRCRCRARWRERVADVALLLSAIAGPDPREPAVDRRTIRRAFRAPLDRDFKGVRVAWWRGLGGIPVRAGGPRASSTRTRGVRDARLRRRGGRAGFHRRRRGVSDAALRRQSPAVRAARRGSSRSG